MNTQEILAALDKQIHEAITRNVNNTMTVELAEGVYRRIAQTISNSLSQIVDSVRQEEQGKDAKSFAEEAPLSSRGTVTDLQPREVRASPQVDTNR